jgi:S1-C subfamily serine protease
MIPKRSLYAMAKALEGLPVLGALAGTPAARAGVRYGDILLEVNGVRTETMLDYIQARGLRSDGMVIVLFRGGERLELALTYDAERPLDPPALLAQVATMRIGPIDAVDDDRGGAS